MTEPTDASTPADAPDEPTFGARFLAAYRARNQAVPGDYAWLQKIKQMDREAFLREMRGQLSYAELQLYKDAEPEAVVDLLAEREEAAAAATVVLLSLPMTFT